MPRCQCRIVEHVRSFAQCPQGVRCPCECGQQRPHDRAVIPERFWDALLHVERVIALIGNADQLERFAMQRHAVLEQIGVLDAVRSDRAGCVPSEDKAARRDGSGTGVGDAVQAQVNAATGAEH